MKKLRLFLITSVFFVLLTVVTNANGTGKFDFIGEYSEGKAVAGVWNGEWKYGYIDKKGSLKIETIFADARSFSEGAAAVGIQGPDKTIKYGFIKDDGSYLIQPTFDEVGDFHKIPDTDTFVAKVGIGDKDSRKYGFVKKDGTYLVSPKFAQVNDYSSIWSASGYTVGFIKKDGEDLYGVLDSVGNLVIDTKYSHLSLSKYDIKQGYICTENKALYGFFDIKRNVIIEPEYTSVIVTDNGLITRKLIDGVERKGFYYSNGMIIEPKYDEIDELNLGNILCRTKLNGKYGLIDKQGKELLENVYDDMFYTDNSILITRDGKTSVISCDGKPVLNEQFDKYTYYEKFKILSIVINGKVGLINTVDYAYLVEPKYDKIDLFFEDGYAKVYLNGKTGIISRNGKVLLEPVYDYIYPKYYLTQLKEEKTNPDGTKTYVYKDDKSKPPVVKVEKDGKEYFYNIDFTPIKSSGSNAVGDFDSIGVFDDGFARVEKNGKVGYVREDFTYIVKPVWDSAYREVDISGGKDQYGDYFHIMQGDKWGIVFMDGTVIEPVSEAGCIVGENIVTVRINNKWRYINKNNKFLNNDEYEFANRFSDGVGLVIKTSLQSYFIDKNGKRISEVYKLASSYREGLAFVYDDSGGRYIDHKGKTIFGEELNLTYGYPFYNGYATVSVNQNGKTLYGILKKNGKWFVEPKFDKVECFGDDKYKYYLDGKEAEVSPDGKIVLK